VRTRKSKRHEKEKRCSIPGTVYMVHDSSYSGGVQMGSKLVMQRGLVEKLAERGTIMEAIR